ncbi:MAG: hypothetical protein ABIG42_11640 [bacterium]
MELYFLSAVLTHDQEVLRWILVIVGCIFLFAGASMYYSAIRLFGTTIGALVAILICYNVTLDGTMSGLTLTFAFILSGIVGALLGSTMALVFHHIVFFAAGALVGIVLFKMFALGMISPDTFGNIEFQDFLALIYPQTQLEMLVMVIGGVIYMISAHLLIVMTMALLGSFIVAYAFNTYYLFPILAALGGMIQYAITKRKIIKVIKKKVPSK